VGADAISTRFSIFVSSRVTVGLRLNGTAVDALVLLPIHAVRAHALAAFADSLAVAVPICDLPTRLLTHRVCQINRSYYACYLRTLRLNIHLPTHRYSFWSLPALSFILAGTHRALPFLRGVVVRHRACVRNHRPSAHLYTAVARVALCVFGTYAFALTRFVTRGRVFTHLCTAAIRLFAGTFTAFFTIIALLFCVFAVVAQPHFFWRLFDALPHSSGKTTRSVWNTAPRHSCLFLISFVLSILTVLLRFGAFC